VEHKKDLVSKEETEPPAARKYTDIPLYKNIPPEKWNDWRWQIQNSIKSIDVLKQIINLSDDEIEGYNKTIATLAMSITPYYASLMDPDNQWCPIRMQSVPTLAETLDVGFVDSLGEESCKVAPGLVHRYPDRVLLLVNNMCQLYCRHCTRKRFTGKSNTVLSKPELDQAFEYIKNHPEVRDVLISGGDPFMLSDANIEYIISNLRKINTVEIIRIGTRAPVTIPQRITQALVDMLKKYHPIWINTHFNHPKEFTEESRQACARIADAGIPLGNQTVLLRKVNSSPRIIKDLMHRLVMNRVRPYYLYQCDLESGLEHFRTPLETGIEIMESLRGWTSGYAIPTFVVDAPGGMGKIPIMPDYLLSLGSKNVKLRNFEGKVLDYPQPKEIDSDCPYERKWYNEPLKLKVI
jgi:lysine 2,3-aminomutase